MNGSLRERDLMSLISRSVWALLVHGRSRFMNAALEGEFTVRLA